VRTATIGSQAAGCGLTYDGHLYYLLDSTTPSIIAFAYMGGTFYPVRTVMNGAPSATGTYTYTSLTHNGHDLLLAVEHTVNVPPLVTYQEIILWSKSGYYKRLVEQTNVSTTTRKGIDFDGLHIHTASNRSTVPAVNSARKHAVEGVAVFTAPTTGRSLEDYLFDGLNPIYPISATGSRVAVSDHFFGSALVRTSGALGQATQGIVKINDPGVGDFDEYDCFQGGDLVAVLSTA